MRLKVLVVDLASRGLAETIDAADFEIVGRVSAEEDLFDQVQALQPDAVIIDAESPRRDTLEHLAGLSRRYPRPMVLLSEHARPELLNAATNAGISAYLAEGISPNLVRSLIDVTVHHFRGHQALHDELERTRRKLEERTLIDRAKCLLMECDGLSEREAYQRLRGLAMERQQRMAALAADLLRTAGPTGT